MSDRNDKRFPPDQFWALGGILAATLLIVAWDVGDVSTFLKDWAAAGLSDTKLRCHDGTGGGLWDEGYSAGSLNSRR